jgi:hypothetical protein
MAANGSDEDAAHAAVQRLWAAGCSCLLVKDTLQVSGAFLMQSLLKLALQQPGGKVCATGGCRVILHIALHLCVHAKCAPLCVHAGGAGASGAVAGALQDSSAQAGELLLVMHCAAVNVH